LVAATYRRAMRIAFVGAKGSGKSTCAAVFSRHLAARGLPVLAVDAADGRLAALLGRPTPPEWSPGDGMFGLSPDGLVRLTPTAAGPPSAGTPRCASAGAADGVHLVATDAFDVLLDHLADGPGEYVVVDLAADGAASARYDLTLLVAEPMRRAVGLYRVQAEHAAADNAALLVLGNTTSDGGDATWLTEQIGDALLGCVGHSARVRAAERGTAGSVSGFEPGNTVALAAVRSALDARPRKLQQGGPTSGHPAEVVRAYSASRR
jgi:CO dehydrogenase maturation factor